MGVEKETFEQTAYKLFKEKNKEIFSFVYEDKKYWLKKARPTKSNFMHKLVYKVFSIEVLIPVLEKKSHESIYFETSKINSLKEKQINTPFIKLINKDFFILEDCGKTVNSYLKDKNLKKEKAYNLIDLVLAELSKIHNEKEFHGGPQTRNFTFKDGKIYTIDFEENFDTNIDIVTLQVRDLILFLISIARLKLDFDFDYESIINRYIELSPQNKYFKEKLKTLASKISFLISFSQVKFINRIIGKEARSFFKLFLMLKNLKG